MATASEGFETPANGAALNTTNCPTLANVGKTANNTMVCSTAQHAAGTKSARITTGATADTAPMRMDFTATATPHFRIYYYLDRLPTTTEANMYALSARTATPTSEAYVRILSTGAVQLRDGNSLASGSGATTVSGLITAATLFRLEWFIDVAGGTQTCRIFIGANAHGTTPDTTATGGYTGANIAQIIGSWNNNMANMGLYMDDFGYNDAAYMGPSVVSSGLAANAGVDQTNRGEGNTVNLGGSATGGSGIYTYTWTQTGGTTVTLTGTGANKSFIVPTLSAAETLTFQLSVNDGSTTATDSMTVGVLRQIVPNAGSDQTNKGAGSTVTLGASAAGGNNTFLYTWSQIAGTSVTLSSTSIAAPNFTVPTNTGETLTFNVSITDTVGSTAKSDTVDIGITPANTNIAAYTKNFNSGTNGASAIGAFSSGTGTAPTYTNVSPAPLEGAMSCQMATSAALSTNREDDIARGLVWRLVQLSPKTLPAANTGFVRWLSGNTIIGDIQITPTGTLRLRDGAASVFDGTATLSVNTKYYLAIKAQPTLTSTTGHRYKLYSATGTLLEDSGNRAANVGQVTTMDNFRWGVLSSATMSIVFDDMQGDSAVELFPPSTAITANAGADQTNKVEGSSVGVSGSATGGNGVYTYAWSQLSGPTVTLTGSGANRTFTTPGTGPGTVVLQLSVTDSAGSTAGTDTVSIGILAPIVANAGTDQTNIEPFTVVTLSASASGGVSPYTYAWTQVSGATVTLSGSGSSRTYVAPAVANGDTATFRVSVVGTAGSTPHTDDVQVTTLPHDNFYYDTGVARGFVIKLRSSGAWV